MGAGSVVHDEKFFLSEMIGNGLMKYNKVTSNGDPPIQRHFSKRMPKCSKDPMVTSVFLRFLSLYYLVKIRKLLPLHATISVNLSDSTRTVDRLQRDLEPRSWSCL